MARTLEEAGYKVLQAGGGAEALGLIRAGHRPHLVLTDVVMQGMSGRELAEQVEQLVPGTPVLFTSGYTDGEIARQGLLERGVPFIQKPLTPTGLVAAVHRAIAVATRPSAAPGGAV
jgi:two-component system cell cycle sensor histidine kinase/response regulator CckA